MDAPEKIDRFRGRWEAFSNFYRDRRRRPNENYFQAAKTTDTEARKIILESPQPREAKYWGSRKGMAELSDRLGREISLRPDWDAICDDVMMWGLEQKFADPELRAILLSSGDAYLDEGNTWCDTRWGVCYCSKHNGVGENRLGLALMELRVALRAETV